MGLAIQCKTMLFLPFCRHTEESLGSFQEESTHRCRSFQHSCSVAWQQVKHHVNSVNDRKDSKFWSNIRRSNQHVEIGDCSKHALHSWSKLAHGQHIPQLSTTKRNEIDFSRAPDRGGSRCLVVVSRQIVKRRGQVALGFRSHLGSLQRIRRYWKLDKLGQHVTGCLMALLCFTDP